MSVYAMLEKAKIAGVVVYRKNATVAAKSSPSSLVHRYTTNAPSRKTATRPIALKQGCAGDVRSHKECDSRQRCSYGYLDRTPAGPDIFPQLRRAAMHRDSRQRRMYRVEQVCSLRQKFHACVDMTRFVEGLSGLRIAEHNPNRANQNQYGGNGREDRWTQEWTYAQKTVLRKRSRVSQNSLAESRRASGSRVHVLLISSRRPKERRSLTHTRVVPTPAKEHKGGAPSAALKLAKKSGAIAA